MIAGRIAPPAGAFAAALARIAARRIARRASRLKARRPDWHDPRALWPDLFPDPSREN